jgi:hypothetical protein
MRKYLIFTMLLATLSISATEAKRGGGGHFGMHIFDKIDTNDDNKVSQAEFNTFHNERFLELDADKNLEISLEEAMNFKRAKKEEFRKKFDQ